MSVFNADGVIELQWNTETAEFTMQTNVKEPKELILDFIQTQFGAGEDNTPREEQDVYKIKLEIDLSDDTFRTTHNCGNKGLRDGILLHYAETH